jgi:transposase-like protein
LRKACQDIRAGVIGRRDAQRMHHISANLIHMWLTQFDRGELSSEEAEASVIAEYEAKIAALERKVGQLTMELDLCSRLCAKAPTRNLANGFSRSTQLNSEPLVSSRPAHHAPAVTVRRMNHVPQHGSRPTSSSELFGRLLDHGDCPWIVEVTEPELHRVSVCQDS